MLFTCYQNFIGRKKFPEIIQVAYRYILDKTALYLKKSLPSTGFPPHFGVAIDKSTPHRDTNQAIVLLIPSEGKRVAIPIDAPLVYAMSESNTLEGGAHIDLAEQIFDVLKNKLEIEDKDLHFLRGNLISYQSKTAQCLM